tara:strand:- start:23164 stop:23586 length:423 start_codon:yes stop_codon:yes gene_type:complete
MSRILGIDFGSRRVGLALSDVTRTIASPLKFISYKSLPELLNNLKEIIADFEVSELVVGYPIGMKGQMTRQTEEVDKFIENLRKQLNINVIPVDERLTSVQSSRILQEQGIKSSRNKGAVDMVSASIILQSYLDANQKND